MVDKPFEDGRYFTLVFERREDGDMGPNPFTTDSPWGRAVAASISHEMRRVHLIEEAINRHWDFGVLQDVIREICGLTGADLEAFNLDDDE